MAEPTREERRDATTLVDRLFERGHDGIEIPPDVVVSDVEADVRTFSNELSFLNDFGADVPAALIGDEVVPVSLSVTFNLRDGLLPPFSLPFDPRDRRHSIFYEYLYRYLGPMLREHGAADGFTTMKPEEARKTFGTRAASFVATRFASVREYRHEDTRHTWQRPSLLNLSRWLGGPQVMTPGCHFTVSTNSNGLRVFWSGAYWITPNNFNHPTSPTSSVLQSGTYVFGVDGGAYGNRVQWDKNAVVTLPGAPYVHLNF